MVPHIGAAATRGILAGHRCDEGVTSARVVNNVALAGTTIGECFAQLRNVDPEGSLFDDRVGPSPCDELLLRDCLAGALNQRTHDVKRSATEAQGFPVL